MMNRIELAEIAIKKAGETVKEGFETDHTATHVKANVNDLVTQYDTRAQTIIISLIEKHFPDDAIVAEEDGYNNIDAKTGWVIDPIDGTNPFSRKMTCFGIVIGYMVDFEAEFCLVYNPILDELFKAEKGCGTTVNGEKVQIANRPMENQFIALEGFGTKKASELRLLLQDYVYNITGRSCSCASTMMTSRGQTDSFIQKANNIWDRIHYILLSEAGAKLTNFKGEKYTVDQTDYFACHPELHSTYVKMIAEVLDKSKIPAR